MIEGLPGRHNRRLILRTEYLPAPLRQVWMAHPQLPRMLRFATAGAVSAAAQLAILSALLDVRIRTSTANLAAFLVSAQINFVLNRWFTWGDRQPSGLLAATWMRFMCAVAATVMLNLAAFAVADRYVPSLIAGAMGIGVVAVANFVIADRAVFRAAT